MTIECSGAILLLYIHERRGKLQRGKPSLMGSLTTDLITILSFLHIAVTPDSTFTGYNGKPLHLIEVEENTAAGWEGVPSSQVLYSGRESHPRLSSLHLYDHFPLDLEDCNAKWMKSLMQGREYNECKSEIYLSLNSIVTPAGVPGSLF